jgi:hypothetical protein
MTKTPLVCYYSALNPENQQYLQPIPNENKESPYQEGSIFMQTYPLFNDNNIEIGVLKTDGTSFTFKNDESFYENRVWTAFFYGYGSVSFPVTFGAEVGDGIFFAPGLTFKMPILYCSGNDLYNQTGTVEFIVNGNDVKSRTIIIKFD